MKKLLLPICLIIFALVSCKKDKDEPTCVVSTASVTGNYKITAGTYKQTPSSADLDFFASLDACEKDDIYGFAASGVLNYQDAGTVCSPNGSYSGTWSLSGTTMLNLDGELTTIQSFTCSTLIITLADFITTGDKLTITFVRQ